MPEFKYVGDAGRSYPTLPAPANGPVPGESYTLRTDPGDGRWQSTEKHTAGRKPAKKSAAKAEQSTDPAPAGEKKE